MLPNSNTRTTLPGKYGDRSPERFQEQNHERAEALSAKGHHFRNPVEVLFCWRWEVFL
jgi:hypothetical protein